jgi:hypothetical protein
MVINNTKIIVPAVELSAGLITQLSDLKTTALNRILVDHPGSVN